VDLDDLGRRTNALVVHCNRNLDAAFRKAAEYMHEYFQIDNRHKPCKPRICVKTAFEGKIVDLFRDCGPTMSNSFPSDQNTGFDSTIKDGKHFVCNDIPKVAKKGLYLNTRLDSRHVADYKIPTWFGKHICSRFSDEPHADTEWEKCWDVGSPSNPKPETCYKSTLIIPMTLRGADVSRDLREILHLDATHEKSTFGYLCFDHRQTGFFREADIDVGYFFADMLSLYMINHKNYIHNSGTFNEVHAMLLDAGRIGKGIYVL